MKFYLILKRIHVISPKRAGNDLFSFQWISIGYIAKVGEGYKYNPAVESIRKSKGRVYNKWKYKLLKSTYTRAAQLRDTLANLSRRAIYVSSPMISHTINIADESIKPQIHTCIRKFHYIKKIALPSSDRY